MAVNLPGNGTKESPYLIAEFDDFKKIDAPGAGLYYKLTRDINMLGSTWDFEVNLNNGFLDMSDHKIEFATVTSSSMFRKCTIYAEREEYIDGIKFGENKAGYILNIMGGVQYIFAEVSLIRIGLSFLNLNPNTVACASCFFLESNVYYKNILDSTCNIITLAPNTQISSHAAVDTIFDIDYAPRDKASIINAGGGGVTRSLERCMINVNVNLRNGVSFTGTRMINATARSCILMAKSYNNDRGAAWNYGFNSEQVLSFMLKDEDDPDVLNVTYPNAHTATEAELKSINFLTNAGFSVEPEK